MATAELAVAMPALALVLALSLSTVRLGMDQVLAVDAARAAARELARGETVARAEHEARAVMPDLTHVAVVTSGETARATVTGRTPSLLRAVGVSAVPSWTATARTEEVAP